MGNKIAIIDLGTNTFHLLVADLGDQGPRIIHQERVAVKIGEGGINDGRITNKGSNRALQTLHDFKVTLAKYEANTIIALGTSALRSAINGSDIIQKIKKETGIETRILSGDDEATYIYKGVQSAMKLGNAKSLIVDIGGGSVEFIIGNEKEIFWKQSFEIGAQRLLERYQKHDPILPEEIEALYDFFKISLGLLSMAIDNHQPKTLIGSSGTFDTLSDIYCFKNNIQRLGFPETPFAIKAFYEIFAEFKSKNRAERLQIPGMIEMRVDMIVVACCLVNFILTNFSFHQVRVSAYSLKEGVLASITENLK